MAGHGRLWRPGDRVDVSLPMALALNRTPDRPAMQAVTYCPACSAAATALESLPMPGWSPESVTRIPGRRLRFAGHGGRPRLELIPIARMHHQHYNVYWLT